MVITAKVNLDFQKPSYPSVINAVQGDQNTRRLEISLYSGSVAWKVPETATVAMRYEKPDATKGYYDTMPDGSSAFTVSRNTVSILLAPQMLTVPGTVNSQVVLMQGMEILSTFAIKIHVEADPSAGVMESEDYTNWAQWIKNELDKYLEKVKVNGELIGGSVVGSLNMNQNHIYGLPAPTEDDQAANMGFVNVRVRKAAPLNLLDNSDFRNPVNQRGQTIYTGFEYTIDRWLLSGNAGEQNTMWISEDGYIGLSGGNTVENVWLVQRVPSNVIPTGNEATFAVKQNGVETPYILNIDMWGTDKVVHFPSGVSLLYQSGELIIYNGTGNAAGFVWAALYEGEYTAETLPEYQPKGYGAELAECQLYCRMGEAYVGNGNSGYGWVNFDRPMRVNPTMAITNIAGSATFREANRFGFNVENITGVLELFTYAAFADL